uniref:Uncharacterized protein MANES_08G157700 n=1 Tax=Rhizophora mucronata TaxID=61149 RepID=A0A2P2M697_RHIMU
MERLNDVGFLPQSSDGINRHTTTHCSLRKLKGDDSINYLEDREAMELYSQVRAQKEEIQILREQIATACVRVGQFCEVIICIWMLTA